MDGPLNSLSNEASKNRHVMRTSLLAHPIIPVVEISDPELAIPLAEALLKGGISIVEITLRTEHAMKAIRLMCQQCPDMLVGAGTVLNLDQSKQVIDAGVQFGVSPAFNSRIIENFHQHDLLFIPGVLTPTELETAVYSGCKLLKFFPAGVSGGPAFLQAIAAPYTNYGVTFCATGGVTLDNMLSYFKVPIVSNVGGSWIASKRQIENKCWDEISDQCLVAVELLKNFYAGINSSDRENS